MCHAASSNLPFSHAGRRGLRIRQAYGPGPGARLSASAPIRDIELRESRSSASDLELGGELAGLRRGAMLYITLNDLLTLPQVSYVVADDSNLAASTKISGVALSNCRASWPQTRRRI